MDYIWQNDLLSFAELLKTDCRIHTDSEDAVPKSIDSTMGPGSIGPHKAITQLPTKDKFNSRQNQSQDIWVDDEVREEEDELDVKEKPEYDFVFKQHVTTEDLFLQMGHKGPSSASCECLVVKIKLPEINSFSEINLKISEEILDCTSLKYKLNLPLPHHVNPGLSKAEWDQQSCTLTVTTYPVRELDYLNF